VTIELDISQEPISGELHDTDGTIRPFTGWLGLVATVAQSSSANANHARSALAQPARTGQQRRE
jgi:hypothetical protein